MAAQVFPDNGMLTEAEKYFNRNLCKMRFVVEHAFGRLKGRWRSLLKRNDTTMQYIIQQTAACCILHNLCEMQEEEFEDWRVDVDADIGQHHEDYEDDDAGETVRNALKTFLENQRHM